MITRRTIQLKRIINGLDPTKGLPHISLGDAAYLLDRLNDASPEGLATIVNQPHTKHAVRGVKHVATDLRVWLRETTTVSALDA